MQDLLYQLAKALSLHMILKQIIHKKVLNYKRCQPPLVEEKYFSSHQHEQISILKLFHLLSTLEKNYL